MSVCHIALSFLGKKKSYRKRNTLQDCTHNIFQLGKCIFIADASKSVLSHVPDCCATLVNESRCLFVISIAT